MADVAVEIGQQATGDAGSADQPGQGAEPALDPQVVAYIRERGGMAETPPDAEPKPQPEAPAETPKEPSAEPETKPEEPKEQPQLSELHERLGRQEAKYRESEKLLKAELAKARQERDELAKYRWDPSKETELEYAQRVGIDYNKLTQQQIQGGLSPEEKQARQVQQMRDELAQQVKELQSRLDQNDQQRVDAGRQNDLRHIQSALAGSEDFGLVHELGHHEAVLDAAYQRYQETQQVPDVGEIARQVESQLVDELKRVANIPKAKRFLMELWGLQEAPQVGEKTGEPQARQETEGRTESGPMVAPTITQGQAAEKPSVTDEPPVDTFELRRRVAQKLDDLMANNR